MILISNLYAFKVQSKHNFEFICNLPIIDDNIFIVMIINITIVEIVRHVFCTVIVILILIMYINTKYVNSNYTIDDDTRLL